MRIVVQRVKKASVKVADNIVGEIGNGLLLFVGIEDADEQEDLEWLSKKVINMRIFPDEEKPMNRSVEAINGELLVVSQFTLHASTKKGNRPSFVRAAAPDKARSLYEHFVEQLRKDTDQKIATGAFGEMMEVSLVNDGPVTIIMDSKNKE